MDSAACAISMWLYEVAALDQALSSLDIAKRFSCCSIRTSVERMCEVHARGGRGRGLFASGVRSSKAVHHMVAA
jgi:hypothetical protein